MIFNKIQLKISNYQLYKIKKLKMNINKIVKKINSLPNMTVMIKFKQKKPKSKYNKKLKLIKIKTRKIWMLKESLPVPYTKETKVMNMTYL